MALNYIKTGNQALVDIPPEIEVKAGGFHIIGRQLGVAISGGVGPVQIAVALTGVWDLDCEGDAFDPGALLHFSVPNLKLYAGDPLPSDFENIAISVSAGGGELETCLAKINAHSGNLVP